MAILRRNQLLIVSGDRTSKGALMEEWLNPNGVVITTVHNGQWVFLIEQ